MYICEYNTILDNFVTQLSAANTTTASYDLSSGLDKRVTSVKRSDLEIYPVLQSEYPIVNIRLLDRREYPNTIKSGNFNRTIFLDMVIHAIYFSLSGAETNLWKLLSNIEVNLRYNKNIWGYTYSGFTIQHVIPRNTIFNYNFKGEASVFNMSGKIELEVKGLLKSI